jgi:hypothetical protein
MFERRHIYLVVNLSGQSTVQSGNLSLELWSSGGCPLIAKSAFMVNREGARSFWFVAFASREPAPVGGKML